MCSLVNAKSGGCAEDCGFCAQSRYAEADTPMHAMMEPDQILEHAKAAEAAGAHRFCMVTQGQGLSKRDFEKIVEGARLVAEHTNLKRCVSIGHISAERAKRLADAGVQRVHHNVETARSYYPEVSTTVRYEGRIAHDRRGQGGGARDAASAGSSTSARRPASAWRWPSSWPRSIPPRCRSTCSTRGTGTKFGDRPLMDPWEVVKWVAIFRLILPDALFRLCGGRVENLDELQPLAVKAGLNGVMMGNFLTTLGAEPADDRRDVRGAGAERGPPARQRRQPAARQPLRLARGRDAPDADRGADRQPGRGQLLGSLDAAPRDQEEAQAAALSRSRADRREPRSPPAGATDGAA